MMDVRITFQGLKELISHFSEVKKGLADTLAAGMKEAAFLVEAAGKKQITTGPNRAIRTGYLRASIAVASVMPYRATVAANAFYGMYVHEGTRHMRARPFLAAGLQDAVPGIEEIFGKRVSALVETL